VPSQFEKLDTDFYTQHNEAPIEEKSKTSAYEKNIIKKDIEKSDADVTQKCDENQCCTADEEMCNLKIPKIKQPVVTEAAPKISPNVSNEENSNVQFVCQKIIK
jgi:hypothetical protein